MGTEKLVENQNKEENESMLRVRSFAYVDQLCRSKFHGTRKCKCERRVSGTEVIIGTVGSVVAVGEDAEQVDLEMQHQQRDGTEMLGDVDSDPLPTIPHELNPVDADETQDRLRLIFEEEARLVNKLREKKARLKVEAETRKSINESMKVLLEQLTASERRQEEEESIQLISDQLEYYGKLKQEQLSVKGVEADS